MFSVSLMAQRLGVLSSSHLSYEAGSYFSKKFVTPHCPITQCQTTKIQKLIIGEMGAKSVKDVCTTLSLSLFLSLSLSLYICIYNHVTECINRLELH